jgi:hypothetical protein
MALPFCDRCGFQNRIDARFCSRCGNDLVRDDDETQARAPEPRAQPEPVPPVARRIKRPQGMVLAGLIVLVLVVVIYAAYNVGASQAYSDGVDAHKRFDCSEAADKYGQLIGFYSLALTAHRGTAQDRRAECRAVLQAESAAQDRQHRAAAQQYAEILEEHETSPILDKLQARRAEELLWWGDSVLRRASGNSELLAVALTRYETVLTELPETSQTEDAKKRISQLWASANTGGSCGRADSMLVLRAGDFESDEGQAVQSLATEKAPGYMLSCGNRLIDQQRYGTAIRVLRLLTNEFRGTAAAARARTRLIDAQVGQIRGGRTSDLPSPAVVGPSGSGESEIVIENSSPYNIELLLSGPGSRRFTVPRCPGCRKFASSDAVTSCPSGTKRTFVVRPGSYSVVVRDLSRNVRPWAGTFRIDAGYRYDEGCFYIVTSLPPS